MKKYLFICSANKDRSRTAEDYFSTIYNQFRFDSGGTNQKICNQLGTTFVYREQLEEADKVFVMESKHKKVIESLFGNVYSKKIKILHIKDIYNYGDKQLKDVLIEKMENYFNS